MSKNINKCLALAPEKLAETQNPWSIISFTLFQKLWPWHTRFFSHAFYWYLSIINGGLTNKKIGDALIG
jgi:hypothetical protein